MFYCLVYHYGKLVYLQHVVLSLLSVFVFSLVFPQSRLTTASTTATHAFLEAAETDRLILKLLLLHRKQELNKVTEQRTENRVMFVLVTSPLLFSPKLYCHRCSSSSSVLLSPINDQNLTTITYLLTLRINYISYVSGTVEKI